MLTMFRWRLVLVLLGVLLLVDLSCGLYHAQNRPQTANLYSAAFRRRQAGGGVGSQRRKICGEQLTRTLALLCSARGKRDTLYPHHQMVTRPHETSEVSALHLLSRRTPAIVGSVGGEVSERLGVAEACCERGCSVTTLLTYCQQTGGRLPELAALGSRNTHLGARERLDQPGRQTTSDSAATTGNAAGIAPTTGSHLIVTQAPQSTAPPTQTSSTFFNPYGRAFFFVGQSGLTDQDSAYYNYDNFH